MAARNCAHGKPPMPKQAAFFVQQAAEKLVKAVLVTADVRPRHTHDIGALIGDIPETHAGKQSLADLHRLTPYAVVFRYPSEEAAAEPAPEPIEIDRWIDEVRARKADFERWLAEREAAP